MMETFDSASTTAGGWKLVSADSGLGNPDAAPASTAPIIAQAELPVSQPPPSSTDSIAGDVVLVGGLVGALVLAFLVRSRVLKSQVAKVKPYDEAKTSALIAAIVTFLVVAVLSIGISQYVLKV